MFQTHNSQDLTNKTFERLTARWPAGRERKRMQPETESERDYLGEAFDIIDGKPSEPRTMVRLPEREHLLALSDVINKLCDLDAGVQL